MCQSLKTIYNYNIVNVVNLAATWLQTCAFICYICVHGFAVMRTASAIYFSYSLGVEILNESGVCYWRATFHVYCTNWLLTDLYSTMKSFTWIPMNLQLYRLIRDSSEKGNFFKTRFCPEQLATSMFWCWTVLCVLLPKQSMPGLNTDVSLSHNNLSIALIKFSVDFIR